MVAGLRGARAALAAKKFERSGRTLWMKRGYVRALLIVPKR